MEEEFLNIFLMEQKYKSPSKGAECDTTFYKAIFFCFSEKEEKGKTEPWKVNSFIWTELTLTNIGQNAQSYCHLSSILSFVTPGLDPGLISCENTAWERDREISVIIWQWGLPNSESDNPSAMQHLLIDPALWLCVPRLAASGPWQS